MTIDRRKIFIYLLFPLLLFFHLPTPYQRSDLIMSTNESTLLTSFIHLSIPNQINFLSSLKIHFYINILINNKFYFILYDFT